MKTMDEDHHGFATQIPIRNECWRAIVLRCGYRQGYLVASIEEFANM